MYEKKVQKNKIWEMGMRIGYIGMSGHNHRRWEIGIRIGYIDRPMYK